MTIKGKAAKEEEGQTSDRTRVAKLTRLQRKLRRFNNHGHNTADVQIEHRHVKGDDPRHFNKDHGRKSY